MRNFEFIVHVAVRVAEEKNLAEFSTNFFSNHKEKPELNIPPYIILPENKYKSFFDLVVAILYFYFAFVIPFRIAFYTLDTNTDYIIYEIVFEMVFCVDIALSFLCAYYSNSVLVTNIRSIGKKYLLDRFFLDFIALFPFYHLNAHLY